MSNSNSLSADRIRRPRFLRSFDYIHVDDLVPQIVMSHIHLRLFIYHRQLRHDKREWAFMFQKLLIPAAPPELILSKKVRQRKYVRLVLHLTSPPPLSLILYIKSKWISDNWSNLACLFETTSGFKASFVILDLASHRLINQILTATVHLVAVAALKTRWKNQ